VVLFLLAVAGAAGGAVYWFYFRDQKVETVGPVVQAVLSGPFDNIVLEQGEVESGTNVEIRCEVKSRGTSGITILEVVPEGTLVQEGDLIARLDSTALEQERVQQQITVNTSEATVVQAKNTYEAALIAKTEYLEGTFKLEERTILGEVFVAEQNLRSSQLGYESAERLAAKNIITSLQLEGAQFAVEKTRNELDAAQGKLDVLRKYTKEKLLKQLESDIAIAAAKLKAEESSYELELKKLKDVEDLIAKCTIKAPSAGQVVYVNKYSSSSRGGSSAEFVVEAGAIVREQQPLFRLPDGKNMQIKALVNESRVTRVRVGLPVAIRVDALKDMMLQGEVVKVNQYAEPGGFGSGTVKKYATIVKIIAPPPELRVNMNAEVRIYVERRPEALQIPVQALAEVKGHFFALVKNGEDYETREITVSSTNDQMAVIEKGLAVNEQVVMNPRGHSDKLKLPEIEERSPVAMAEIKPQTTPASSAGGPGGERPAGRPSPAAMVTGMLERMDADKDGKLSAAELASLPEDRRANMLKGDTNQDGLLDRAELTAAAATFRRPPRDGEGGPPGGPGGGAP
jgi:multidrug efflux pump subunit AcrA (membrane-fusion protein)